MNILVFDLEIRENPDKVGWANKAAMGISYGCAWLSSCDEFRLYGEDNLVSLYGDMLQADLVVGFNIIDFDLPLLRATLERLKQPIDDARWARLVMENTYDVLADIREAIGTKFAKGWKLEDVARENLACQKNGDGADAPRLWQEGRHAELCTYVLQDVKVERELWRRVLEQGQLWNKPVMKEALRLPQVQKYRKQLGVPETIADLKAKELAPA